MTAAAGTDLPRPTRRWRDRLAGLAVPKALVPEARVPEALVPEALAWSAAGFMLVLLPATLALLEIDPRTLDGVSVWTKPIKFQLSLGLHFATLAWLVRILTPAAQAGTALRLGFLVAATAGALELIYILLQAGRGRASHFNTETPIEVWLYNAMGVGAVLIVIVALQLGVVIWRHARPESGAGLRLGAVLGLVLGALATLVTAGLLGSGEIAGPGHWVGGIRDDAGGMPLFGWSRTGGDLRVPHFFATHLMQALPLLGLILDRWVAARHRAAFPALVQGLVLAGAVLGLGMVGGTLVQALLGRPFPGF